MECTNGFVRQCVNAEPELPGEMPDALWNQIQLLAKKDDKEGVNKILRTVVKQTKKGILNRINKGIINM